MEVRASYLLVGSIVLALLAGLTAFSVWLVRADVDTRAVRYQIAFEGSVTGLQQGGQVRYRGVPVGRVSEIRIDPQNVEQVLVTAEIQQDTPVKADTFATLEMQGVTGIAYVQLRGGTQESELLTRADGAPLPRIPSRRSALERVYESGPELLASGLQLAERAATVLDQRNVEALAQTLANVETFTSVLANQSDDIEALLGNAASAAARVDTVSGELSLLARDLRRLTGQLDGRMETMGEDVVTTLVELRNAASGLGAAAGELDALLNNMEQPLNDFAQTGLYDFSQLVGETRILVAALNRIATEFERDPAGFLIGSGTGGFRPE